MRNNSQNKSDTWLGVSKTKSHFLSSSCSNWSCDLTVFAIRRSLRDTCSPFFRLSLACLVNHPCRQWISSRVSDRRRHRSVEDVLYLIVLCLCWQPWLWDENATMLGPRSFVNNLFLLNSLTATKRIFAISSSSHWHLHISEEQLRWCRSYFGTFCVEALVDNWSQGDTLNHLCGTIITYILRPRSDGCISTWWIC